MERTWKADYEKFARTARENVAATLDNMDYPALERAAELILAAKAAGKRLHISGIGKPAHLAGYAASLFSSTGTPAYFLHGTEAVHGSCGQLVPGDVVIFISNSGETAEMKATVSEKGAIEVRLADRIRALEELLQAGAADDGAAAAFFAAVEEP